MIYAGGPLHQPHGGGRRPAAQVHGELHLGGNARDEVVRIGFQLHGDGWARAASKDAAQAARGQRADADEQQDATPRDRGRGRGSKAGAVSGRRMSSPMSGDSLARNRRRLQGAVRLGGG